MISQRYSPEFKGKSMLEGEMKCNLGYSKHSRESHHSGNSRYGYSGKIR